MKLAKFLSPDDVIITFNWDTLLDRALNEVYKGERERVMTGLLLPAKQNWGTTQPYPFVRVLALIRANNITNLQDKLQK